MDIQEQLADALDSAIAEMMTDSTAVAFSGGLDSGVIAAMASKHGRIKLYTVGTEGAYDVLASQELAQMMGLEWQHIPLTEETLEDDLRDMISITGTVNPITLSFEVPLYYVMKCSLENNILSGQGADEVFAGYSKYIGLDDTELREQMDRDMMELMENTLSHEKSMAERFGKTTGYPYLSEDVMKIVSEIDIKDIAPRKVRKAFLREVALKLGHPEIAEKPKKAAQYGSGTMDTIRKIAKKKGMTVSTFIESLSEGV